jgi:hypothetical protein
MSDLRGVAVIFIKSKSQGMDLISCLWMLVNEHMFPQLQGVIFKSMSNNLYCKMGFV